MNKSELFLKAWKEHKNGKISEALFMRKFKIDKKTAAAVIRKIEDRQELNDLFLLNEKWNLEK